MRHFINVQEEFRIGHPDREDFIRDNFKNVPLNEKINRRGENEQYATLCLNHYYEDEPIIHRKRKSSKFIGCRLFMNGKFTY